MINKIKKVILVGLGALSLGKKNVKKLYKVGKKKEEKGEYIIDQLLAGIGENKKTFRKDVGKAIKKAKPVVRKAIRKAKPIVRKAVRKAKPVAKKMVRRVKRKASKKGKKRR
tara:strand:+ start:308 stop:643 length:336 start_codon:yes stop_codon:yes gene_type:complete